MKIAILSRPGDCFPNIISLGLGDMLERVGAEYKIFYEGIPFLMRQLPFREQPRHWSNNFHYRVYNKIKYRRPDRKLLDDLKGFDIIVLSECLPNAYWKNYLDIETLGRKLGNKPVISYTDAFIDNAPLHRNKWLDSVDHGKERYTVNLCPSAVTEIRGEPAADWKAIGVNISMSGLGPVRKKEFVAVMDFAQQGYEAYRDQQLRVLNKLGIKTIVLEGRYKKEDIRRIYGEGAVFFLAFPETFGLPIAECLACGTYILTPDTGWPMSWRLDQHPLPWGSGILADCFRSYNGEEELTQLLQKMRDEYDPEKTPQYVYDTFIRYYPQFYFGNDKALKEVMEQLNSRQTR